MALGPDLAARLDALKPHEFEGFMRDLPTEKRQALALIDAGAALLLSSQALGRALELLPRIAIFDPDQEVVARDLRQMLSDVGRIDAFTSAAALSHLGILPPEAQAIGQDLVEAAHAEMGLPDRTD